MATRVVRELTTAERDRIARERPWFGARRRTAAQDLAAGEAEILELSVHRFWDANECAPPCCPRALMVETTDGRFLYLESWMVLPATNALGRNCVAHRTTASKTLLVFELPANR